jgi:DNA-binding transcriptional MerR regulator
MHAHIHLASLALALALGSLQSCSGGNEEVRAAESEGKSGVGGALETVKGDAADFARKLGDEIDGMDVDFEKLREQIGRAGGESRRALEKALDQLETKRAEVAKKLEELRKASGPRVEELRKELAEAYEELERAVSDAMKGSK